LQIAVQKRRVVFKRTIVVRLRLDRVQEAFLREWADNCAALWNAINYHRRQMYFETGRVDLSEDKLLYEAFKNYVGSATAQQVMRKNSEAWRSFLSLKKEMERGELPENVKKVSPPRYWKDRGTGKRRLIIVVRRDLYTFSPRYVTIRAAPRKLLEKYGLRSPIRLRWSGSPRWSGKFGRLEIVYDHVSGKWYAHISVEVETYVDDPPHQPNIAGVDLGVKNIAAVYYSSGEAEVYKGGRLLSDYYYWLRRIERYQSKLNVCGERRSRILLRLYRRMRKRFKHAVKALVKDILTRAKLRGVGVIYIGYPKHIRDRSNNGKAVNSMIHNFWSFKFIIDWFKVKAIEYGIEIILVDEAYTSVTCPICGHSSKSNRHHRGLFICGNCGLVANADVIGAMNIAVRVNPRKTVFSSGSPTGPLAGPRSLHWDYSRWRVAKPPRRGF